MAIITTQYQTNNGFGRVVDKSGNASTQPHVRIRNLGPTTIFISSYTGSSSDGGSDTLQAGFGYPLFVQESLEISNSKFIIQPPVDDSTFISPSIVWTVFF